MQNIKTWEDIVKMDNRYHQLIDEIIRSGYSSLWDSKVINKVIATLKISKIIEFGYEGMPTEENWRHDLNEGLGIYTIVWDPTEKLFYIHYEMNYKSDLAFGSDDLAEEFMSYPENIELLRQFYMI